MDGSEGEVERDGGGLGGDEDRGRVRRGGEAGFGLFFEGTGEIDEGGGGSEFAGKAEGLSGTSVGASEEDGVGAGEGVGGEFVEELGVRFGVEGGENAAAGRGDEPEFVVAEGGEDVANLSGEERFAAYEDEKGHGNQSRTVPIRDADERRLTQNSVSETSGTELSAIVEVADTELE
jgi:hypothetical protein